MRERGEGGEREGEGVVFVMSNGANICYRLHLQIHRRHISILHYTAHQWPTLRHRSLVAQTDQPRRIDIPVQMLR